MKTAMLFAGMIAAMAANVAAEEPGYSVTVTASGLNWKVNWTKAVIDGLKRLSGAKEVSQEDFSGGVATFLVKFDAPPAVTMAGIKKEVGKYKVDKVGMKLTGKATQKGEAWSLGNVALTGDMTSKLAELKGKTIIVVGALTEDDKGKQSLALTNVEELKKK